MNLAVVAVLLCLSASGAGAEDERFHRDRVLMPFVPAAAVEGPLGIRYNPAAVGLDQGLSLSYFHDYTDSSMSGDDALFVSVKGLGFATEWLGSSGRSNGHSYTVALGTGSNGVLNAGSSYQWRSSDDPVQNKSHFWSHGLTLRPGGPLSLAVVVDNYNRMRRNGARSDAEFVYSAAVNLLDGRLMIGGDWYQTTSQNLWSGTYRLAASMEISSGLTAFADIDEDENYFLGGRVDLATFFAGSHSAFHHDDGYRGGVFYAGLSETRRNPVVRVPREILKVRMSGDIPDRQPPRSLFGSPPLTTFDWISLFDKAVEDPTVCAVLVTVDNPRLGWARVEEVRRAFGRLQDAGKPVTVYLEGMIGNQEYYLASAAERIVVPPVSSVDVVGLRAEVTFFKRLLDKLGVNADLEHIGDYKNASDLLTRTSMSDAHREALTSLLNDLDSHWIDEIARARGVTGETVRGWIAHGPYVSVDARDAGMIDAVAHEDELRDIMAADHGPFHADVGARQMLKRRYRNSRWGPSPEVAVVFAEGSIMEGEDGDGLLTGEIMGDRTITAALRRAREDRRVKAVVLRVNSGGGSVFASDAIWREVSRTVGKKPIIVSFGDVAASGGYYIACAADSIFAMPNTITGSIGIISGKVEFSGLYDKIGIDKEVLTRGRYADLYGTSRPFDDAEREVIRQQMTRAYERFVGLVADGRGLPADSVDAIGQGRVWSGAAARELGLIDRYADLRECIEVAARMAGCDDGERVEIRLLPERRWQVFGSGLAPGAMAAWLPGVIPAPLSALLGIGAGTGGDAAYVMPYSITVR